MRHGDGHHPVVIALSQTNTHDMSDSQERFYEKSLRQLEKVESAQQRAKDVKDAATLSIAAIILIFFLFFISPGLLLSGLAVMVIRVKLDVPPWIGIGFLTSIPIFTVFYYKTGKRFKRALGYYSILCALSSTVIYFIISNQR